MKFIRAKEDKELIERRKNAAELVKELYERSRWVRSEENIQNYQKAESWFMHEFNALWRNFAEDKEKSR